MKTKKLPLLLLVSVILAGAPAVFLAPAYAAPAPAAATAAAPTTSRGELIFRAALAASRTDPAKWDWPSSASAEVRKQIIEGNYTQEEKRNIFTSLAQRVGSDWPGSGLSAASADTSALMTPGAMLHGRGFRGLEVYYGGNGYGGISDRVDKVDGLIAHGDRVWINWVIEGRHTGTLFGFAGTGKMLEVPEYSLVRYKDGKVIEHGYIGDDMALYSQAGGKVVLPGKAN